MNGLMAILGLALVLYLMHRMHGRMSGSEMTHDHESRHGEVEPQGSPPGSVPASGGPAAPMSVGVAVLLVIVLALPLMLLHGVLPAGSTLHDVLFWPALLIPIVILSYLWAVGALPRMSPDRRELETQRDALEAEWKQQRMAAIGPLSEHVAKEMDVEHTRYERDMVIFEGRLTGDPELAYEHLTRQFAELGRSPSFLQMESGQTLVVAAPIAAREASPGHQSIGIPVLLFLASLATTAWAGALQQGVNLWRQPSKVGVGLPYALALMAILLVHELGHYIASRLHRIKVSLPYFIPVPMGLGTFGAFIQIRGAIPDRRKLFDVGVAGPFAGLLVALPALFFGLKGSAIAANGTGVTVSSSVLLAWLYAVANGGPVPPNHVVALAPLAFAGWLGLLITALNLIPIGQLDGGHVAYALFGRRRAETVGWVAFFLLLVLGIFYWSGWLNWALVVFFLGGVKHAPALNEIPDPGWQRSAVGAVAFVLLFLIMAPVPHRFMSMLGLKCPYL